MAFCKEFNAATQKQAGDVLPVVITVYKDKTFTFITKSPPAAVLLKTAANIASGSKEPNRNKVGKVTKKQVMDIVKIKRKDLNAPRATRRPSASSRAPRARPASRSSTKFEGSRRNYGINGRKIGRGNLRKFRPFRYSVTQEKPKWEGIAR
ncbi:MAG: hypothetical protein WDO13_11310 [Verrucomicrobiota bacterium]